MRKTTGHRNRQGYAESGAPSDEPCASSAAYDIKPTTVKRKKVWLVNSAHRFRILKYDKVAEEFVLKGVLNGVEIKFKSTVEHALNGNYHIEKEP